MIPAAVVAVAAAPVAACNIAAAIVVRCGSTPLPWNWDGAASSAWAPGS